MSLWQRGGLWVHATLARGNMGWRKRLLLSFAAGAFSALGFAPLEFFPALLAGFAALLLLLDGADDSPNPLRAAALSGWAFAFGQFLVGWHWIGYAFLVDPSAHLWQMPFALLFLTAALALYSGIACAVAIAIWQDGAARLLLFAIVYAVGEWLRGHLFTGFPWNLPGYGWGASLAVLQSTSLFGVYGLSFLTVLLGASLADLATGRLKAPVAMLALFVALWGFGAWRLAQHPTDYVAGVQLRLVQPDVPQQEKYQRAFVARNWQRLVDLSLKPGSPTHIIWPEAAPPFLLSRSPTAMDQITLLTGTDRVLMTGAVTVRDNFYNSLYIFGPGGRLEALYDKFHLVPFGEYVPFGRLLSRLGIDKLTSLPGDFGTGDGPHIYQVTGAPDVTPLICYEIIFPGAVTDHQQRPGWFVNVTDDSWFGPWAGPYQHLLIARVRAIEEAIPVARAANTGVSAVIDPNGRMTARLGLGQMGALDAKLPKALGATFYARFGDFLFFLLLIFAAIIAWLLRRS